MGRAFRNPESLRAERVSRALVKPFLESRGFTSVVDHQQKTGTAIEQLLTATTPEGTQVGLSVRLCWRRNRGNAIQKTYSAAQLMARVPDGQTSLEAVRAKAERRRADGATHMLIIQPNGRKIEYAAMIPIEDLAGIWQKQRDESAKLIAAGALGRQKKNLAENGNSPTIWLQNDKAPTVARALWDTHAVRDLMNAPRAVVVPTAIAVLDDTFDDLPGMDPTLIGSDSPERSAEKRSSVKRDPRVRRHVIKRARGKCERSSCEAHRPFPGFLDVHHILSAHKTDRVWNCVALCPNCHREAHFAPDRDEINAQLLVYAGLFRRRRAAP